MIKTETTEKRFCDKCKKQKLNTPDLCIICKKDLCPYCRFTLLEYVRKYPNNGYSASSKKYGVVCKECIKKQQCTCGSFALDEIDEKLYRCEDCKGLVEKCC